MRDCLGKEINSGDVILYPVRQGSDMWMSLGVVVATKKNWRDREYLNIWSMGSPTWGDTKPDWARTNVFCLDRVVVVNVLDIDSSTLKKQVEDKIDQVLWKK